MTDKEIVERAKEAEKRTGFGELVHSPISKGVNSAFGIGFIEGMVEYRKFMQEEPTTSVWHDASETPTDKSKVLVWLDEELNEIVQCHYMYGKFVEKIPTEEYGRYILVGNEIEGYSRQFLSNKKRSDLTELVVKWAYMDDLLKL